MQTFISKLNDAVDEYSVKLSKIDDAVFSQKKEPDKWSKKEILGHLIDSAFNNVQRFIRIQYEINPHIVYNQNEWVGIQHYQAYDNKELIRLWILLNKHIIFILEKVPADKYDLTCNTGKEKKELHSLKFLAEDYLEHLLHHLKQIV